MGVGGKGARPNEIKANARWEKSKIDSGRREEWKQNFFGSQRL